MRALAHRLSGSVSDWRWALQDGLGRAWSAYDAKCRRVEDGTRNLALAYGELWRRDARRRVLAILAAPLFCLALVVLVVIDGAARIFGVVAAAVVVLAGAAVYAAPAVAAGWAVAAFVTDDSSPAARSADGCDPSYLEVCIPVGSRDLDCPDGPGSAPYAPASNLVVRGRDRHGLDGDGDGIGCES